MKKLLQIALTLTIILTLTACSEIQGSTAVEDEHETPAISANSDQNAAKAEDPITPPDIADETKIEEQVIWEQDGLKVTVTGLDPDGFFGPELQMLIENNSSQNITVQARNCVVNGYMADNTMSSDVAASKKANDALCFDNNSLEACGVDIITDIKFNLIYFNTDSWERIGTSDEISL